jgi:N-acetyl-alpha-D-muramate 1-phosphate uridylyltransferase
VLVVVLAGGLATRMRPSTLDVPKSMLAVNGRPFVDWQLERLAACGYREVVMCIGHLGDAIRSHVTDAARFGVTVRWSHEGDARLGTGGALRHALDLLPPTFLVTYGDSFLPFDYSLPLKTLDASADCDGVMSVFRNDGRWDRSNVETDGAWVLRYEKGNDDPALTAIDYGAIALRRDVVERMPRGPSGLDTLQCELAKAHRLRAVVATERFYEIGSPEGLAALERDLPRLRLR